jgi:pimeloyl-ACP methyl ester carboxylesterase
VNDGVDCEYAVEGHGPAIIFVHGIGASRSAWDAIIPYLREQYTCISYDLRGHGASPVPPPPYTLDQMVSDLSRLHTKLNIDRAHVIGHSLGGMIGPAYARRWPDRVRTLGLLSTAASRSVEDRTKVEAVVASMETHGISNQLPMLVSRWFTDTFIEQNPSVVENRLKQVLATDPTVFLSVFHLYAETEMSPWLAEIVPPSLVLTGEFDGGCSPVLNRIIAKKIPDAELVILDGVKHAILLEAPERVAEEIQKFLARQVIGCR